MFPRTHTSMLRNANDRAVGHRRDRGGLMPIFRLQAVIISGEGGVPAAACTFRLRS
jgi:hypothetical protein